MGRRGKAPKLDSAIRNKKLPILTLDARWHELFPDEKKTARIREYEAKVNQLLMQQGKLVNDIKDMKKLKARLLNEIVANMDASNEGASKIKEKKMEKSRQLINDLNDKINNSMDELADLPYEIRSANELLMAESMKICYDRLIDNKEEIDEIGDWILKTREELKKKIIAKQEMEIANQQIYSYMHDILGADLMESFDKQYSKPDFDII